MPQVCFDSLTATESVEDPARFLADRSAAPQANSDSSKVSEAGDETVGAKSLGLLLEPEPVMQAPSYYIQAAQVQHRAFLTTNLSGGDQPQTTVLGSTWLMGRSRNCAIMVQDRSISRCHAVLGYDVQQGFYIMDVGSSNGTCLNQTRLAVLKRYPLKDGDVIALCNLKVEFFIATATDSKRPQ